MICTFSLSIHPLLALLSPLSLNSSPPSPFLFSSFKFHPFLPNILVKKYLIHLRQVFFFHLSSPLAETSFLFPFSFWLLGCSLELLLLRRQVMTCIQPYNPIAHNSIWKILLIILFENSICMSLTQEILCSNHVLIDNIYFGFLKK